MAAGHWRCSALAVLLCLVLIALSLIHLGFGVETGDGSPPIWLMLPMLTAAGGAALSALGGGVAAVLAILRGERSGLILFPVACAFIALTFLVGELVFGHE